MIERVNLFDVDDVLEREFIWKVSRYRLVMEDEFRQFVRVIKSELHKKGYKVEHLTKVVDASYYFYKVVK